MTYISVKDLGWVYRKVFSSFANCALKCCEIVLIALPKTNGEVFRKKNNGVFIHWG